jgi:hypothetical protein
MAIRSQDLAPQACAEPDIHVETKGTQMNYQRNTIAAILLAAIAGVSSAQGLTRAEVKAQLAEAIRNGDMLAPGESGLTERQLNPSEYPAEPAAPGKTRAQVKSELQAAIADGDILAPGDAGLTERQENPNEYPAQPVVAGKTRQQVRNELAQAIRDGDMVANGNSGLTDYEMAPQEYAAQRAADGESTSLAHQSPPQPGTVQAVSAATP